MISCPQFFDSMGIRVAGVWGKEGGSGEPLLWGCCRMSTHYNKTLAFLGSKKCSGCLSNPPSCPPLARRVRLAYPTLRPCPACPVRPPQFFDWVGIRVVGVWGKEGGSGEPLMRGCCRKNQPSVQHVLDRGDTIQHVLDASAETFQCGGQVAPSSRAAPQVP